MISKTREMMWGEKNSNQNRWISVKIWRKKSFHRLENKDCSSALSAGYKTLQVQGRTRDKQQSRVQKEQPTQWIHPSLLFSICKATGILWLTFATLLPGRDRHLGNNKSNQKSVKHILFLPEEKMTDGTWQQSSSPSKLDKTRRK